MSCNKFTLIVFSVLNFQFGHENYCRSLNLKQIYWGLFSYHICLPLILSRLYSVHKIQHGWVLHLRRPNLINWKWELLDRFLPGAKHKHPNKCFVAFQDEKNLNHCWIINVYVPKTEFFLFFFSLVWKNFITPSLLSSSRGIQYCTNILGSLYGDCHELLALLQYPKHAMIGYLRVSIQNNPKNRSNYTVSYAQTCYRTKIKLTLAVTNRKCRRIWFKTSHNGEQNNPLGVAKKGGVWKLSLPKLLVKWLWAIWPYQIVQICTIRS